MKREPLVVSVLERISHHASGSGADGFVRHTDNLLVDPHKPSGWLRSLVPASVSLAAAQATGKAFYEPLHFLSECEAQVHMLKTENAVVHFHNGDNNFFYCGRAGKRNGKLIATYHQPPWRLEATMAYRSHLRRLDRVVMVGTKQAVFFRRYMDESKLVHIPLGVDARTFSPSYRKRNGKHFVVVGQHLRDVPLLYDVLAAARRRWEGVHFTWVVPQHVQSLPEVPGLEIRRSLRDSELLELYRGAAAVLLPLAEATANCALLEAMACASPVVVTDVGSIRDYVDDETAYVTQVSWRSETKAQRFMEGLEAVMERPDEAVAKGRAARERVLARFDLPVIARQYQQLYRHVAGL